MNCHAKRLECVQLAGAVVRRGAVRKREQAPRTPNASRSSVAAWQRYVLRVLCTAVHPNHSFSRGFFVRTQKIDRIMAGQNHAEPRPDHCRQDHKGRGPITLLLMILSCHDSVAFHLVAALPRCALCVRPSDTIHYSACAQASPGPITRTMRSQWNPDPARHGARRPPACAASLWTSLPPTRRLIKPGMNSRLVGCYQLSRNCFLGIK
jgi:hypothetical protein